MSAIAYTTRPVTDDAETCDCDSCNHSAPASLETESTLGFYLLCSDCPEHFFGEF